MHEIYSLFDGYLLNVFEDLLYKQMIDHIIYINAFLLFGEAFFYALIIAIFVKMIFHINCMRMVYQPYACLNDNLDLSDMKNFVRIYDKHKDEFFDELPVYVPINSMDV